MHQDIIPPQNAQSRGTLRPAARVEPVDSRSEPRQAVPPRRSIDGVIGGGVGVVPVVTPVPATAPVPPVAAAPLTSPDPLVSDVKRVSLAPISQPTVPPNLEADMAAEVEGAFAGNGADVGVATDTPDATEVTATNGAKSTQPLSMKKKLIISGGVIVFSIIVYVVFIVLSANT